MGTEFRYLLFKLIIKIQFIYQDYEYGSDVMIVVVNQFLVDAGFNMAINPTIGPMASNKYMYCP